MIVDLDYVSLPVEDMDAAVAFYRDVLGLTLAGETTPRWAEFQLDSLRLALYPGEPGERPSGEVAFRVKNLEEVMDRLRDAGVPFPHGIETFDLPSGRGRLARFRDPSGNRLELVERASPD